MLQRIRLGRELAKISNSGTKGICVSPKDEFLEVLEAQITGPDDTPYEKGLFKLEIRIPDNYPFTPPYFKFVTRMYHPNIDERGRICLDLLKMPPLGGWKPTLGIEAILIAIRMLLESPNPDDPLIAGIAEEYKRDNANFVKNARAYTEKYAH